MAWRAIQSSAPVSESLALLSDFAERLYWRMVSQSDPCGRLPGSTTKIRGQCAPLLNVSDAQVAEALEELVKAHRIVLGCTDGIWVCQLLDFEQNQPRRAYRLAYELWREPIPDGLQIDHLCRNTSCVNPWHLEPVTCAENIARSPRALATHCQHGHEFTPENTRRYAGRRWCRACAAARQYARRNGLDFESVARARPAGVDLRRTPS